MELKDKPSIFGLDFKVTPRDLLQFEEDKTPHDNDCYYITKAMDAADLIDDRSDLDVQSGGGGFK